MTPPRQGKTALHVHLPERLHRAVAVVAEHSGLSLTAATAEALEDWLKKRAANGAAIAPCAHENSKPAERVPGFVCSDCGALWAPRKDYTIKLEGG